ncbi:guanylate cyclase [Roseibium aquae]|uniref:Guanylate cyclase n=1 Tax=Roseibium aquae TaxID=1323746 RepID=A0A916TLW3_9HYPH|nr:heme NO-binding domain-containing protein [Roseibium aquae]GGB58452.1 guanylate cyclase [Roseibium aquae]
MKGMVFNEFFELVDTAFGPNTTEDIIADANLPHAGAYTTVGRYDASEMVRLVKALSARTQTPVPDLLQTFGRHLLDSFKSGHAQYFHSCRSVFDFVSSIEAQIHIDVLKLYPDAELPSLRAEAAGTDKMTLLYRSSRRMADLAEGLLWGAIDHYGDPVELERTDLPDEGSDQCTRFTLTRR